MIDIPDNPRDAIFERAHAVAWATAVIVVGAVLALEGPLWIWLA